MLSSPIASSLSPYSSDYTTYDFLAPLPDKSKIYISSQGLGLYLRVDELTTSTLHAPVSSSITVRTYICLKESVLITLVD